MYNKKNICFFSVYIVIMHKLTEENSDYKWQLDT